MSYRGGGSHVRVHGEYSGLRIAAVPWGTVRAPQDNPRLPGIRERLYLRLQQTNYVRASDIAPYQDRLSAVRVLQEAGMVLYHEQKDLWVPDERTLRWVVNRRAIMIQDQPTKGRDHGHR